jgi:hypothetical protein
MQKKIFLENDQTQDFTNWFEKVINGDISINYKSEKKLYRSFNEIKDNYSWPPKDTNLLLPNENITIKKNSSLAANQELLNKLAEGLKEALYSKSDEELQIWVKAIFVWGGVFTFTKNRKGNAGWLEHYCFNGGLSDYLSATFKKINSLQDDDEVATINDLRSNAGLTKVYALGCDNFIIYDSRVAAALTWLLAFWAQDSRLVPDYLRFSTMRANTSKKEGKQRTSNEKIFPYFTASGERRNHNKHLLWNIRANWLLEQTLEKVKLNSGSDYVCSMRDLEASLFVIGDDLRYAKQY